MGSRSDTKDPIEEFGSAAVPAFHTEFPFTDYNQIKRDKIKIALEISEDLDVSEMAITTARGVISTVASAVYQTGFSDRQAFWIKSEKTGDRALFVFRYTNLHRDITLDIVPDKVVTEDLEARDLCEEEKAEEEKNKNPYADGSEGSGNNEYYEEFPDFGVPVIDVGGSVGKHGTVIWGPVKDVPNEPKKCKPENCKPKKEKSSE